MAENREELHPQRAEHEGVNGTLDGPFADFQVLVIDVFSLDAVRDL